MGRARDRRDLRRDGRRAQRRDVTRAHRGLRSRPRASRRDCARRDGRHGLLAAVRRPRLRARGGAGGDRDVRGHAAGPGRRPDRRGRLREPRARAARDRHRRGDLEHHVPGVCEATTRRSTRPRTSSSRPPAASTTTSSWRSSSARSSGGRIPPPEAQDPPAAPQAPKPGLRFQRKDTEQYHVCLGATGVSRADRRRFAASILDAILGGSASSRLFQEIREKRGMAYAVYSFLSQYADTDRSGSTSARARTTSPRRSRSLPSRSPTSPAVTCGPTSSSARRKT